MPPSNAGSVHTCQGGQSRLRILGYGDQERGSLQYRPLKNAHLPSVPAFVSSCASGSESWSLSGPGVPASDPPLSSPDPEELLLGSSATHSSLSLSLASSLEELSYLGTGWEASAEPTDSFKKGRAGMNLCPCGCYPGKGFALTLH